MSEAIKQLKESSKLSHAGGLADTLIAQARRGRLPESDRRAFVRALVLNPALNGSLQTPDLLDHVFTTIDSEEWSDTFGQAVKKELPGIVVALVDGQVDLSHDEVLRLAPGNPPATLVPVLRELGKYVDGLKDSRRLVRGMRVSRIQADLYARLADDRAWRRRKIPPFALDGDNIVQLKEERRTDELSAAYEALVNRLQRRDLRRCLAAAKGAPRSDSPDAVNSPDAEDAPARMKSADYEKRFVVRAPLRLGISSANASDNHLRSKEQGGKTLNAGIDLAVGGDSPEPTPPLSVSARRLIEPRLILRSQSSGFEAEFEADARGAAGAQSDLFFAYRRGGDESLRMIKQALVHTGIVGDESDDVVRDVAYFADGGGLEIVSTSSVLQGSGLGTSSILAAAILKVLYRLTGHEAGTVDGEYPSLYDESVLLEQSIGLNSGWQDARGACGGPSAVKDFYAPPTDGLPTPELTFVETDEDLVSERMILFDTGISRAATRGLNVVLDAYLSRDRGRYGAIRESLDLHEEIVGAVRSADYAGLGRLATRYWELRCVIDPDATNDSIRHLFEAPELADLCHGGMLTGAGGGGFALLISREGAAGELVKKLARLKERRAFARSSVVQYHLNRTGLHLQEQEGAR